MHFTETKLTKLHNMCLLIKYVLRVLQHHFTTGYYVCKLILSVQVHLRFEEGGITGRFTSSPLEADENFNCMPEDQSERMFNTKYVTQSLPSSPNISTVDTWADDKAPNTTLLLVGQSSNMAQITVAVECSSSLPAAVYL